MKKRGLFIVIEGTDGSGKTEQFTKLLSRLRAMRIAVSQVDFPQYEKPSSYFVREYLNGKYGGWKEVGPYKASLFYALDRFDVAPFMRQQLNTGKILVSNRYVPSSMGHQGTKIATQRARLHFFRWLYDLEYRILNIPRPDLTIILHMPADVSSKLVDKKGHREYIRDVKRDIHEADIRHLRQAEKTYLSMARLFPDEFTVVECVEGKTLLTINRIHEKVWDIVSKKVSRR